MLWSVVNRIRDRKRLIKLSQSIQLSNGISSFKKGRYIDTNKDQGMIIKYCHLRNDNNILSHTYTNDTKLHTITY